MSAHRRALTRLAATALILAPLAILQPSLAHAAPSAPQPAISQSFLAQFAQMLRSFQTYLSTQQQGGITVRSGGYPPEYIAAQGNGSGAGRIDQLSNTTITNPTITGGSISGASIVGTISNAIDSALGTIGDLTSNTVNATNVSFANATTTNLAATNLTASATSTLSGLKLASTDCSAYGNGGKLTTDAFGMVVCAADQGGAGGTVGGLNTQIQFNDGGLFGGSASLTFDKVAGRITFPYASTTAISANTLTLATPLAATSGGTGSTTLSGILKGNGTSGVQTALPGTDYELPLSFNAPLSRLGNSISLSTAGDWSGTLGGFSAAQLVAAGFSTTSADTWKANRSFFATSSTDFWLTQKTTDNLAQGASNNYYATTLFSTDLAATTTSALAEGSNLYFTNARADARINATSTIGTLTSAPNLSTVANSLSGFLKATAGALSTAAINLASDITGILPVANGGTGWSAIAAGAIPYGNGSSALATTSAGTAGQVLALLGGVPTWTATTTFSAPLSYANGAVSLAQANGSTNGYLASSDWAIFNNKISSSSLSATYPLAYNSATGIFSTAFSTTTANTWGAPQTITLANASGSSFTPLFTSFIAETYTTSGFFLANVITSNKAPGATGHREALSITQNSNGGEADAFIVGSHSTGRIVSGSGKVFGSNPYVWVDSGSDSSVEAVGEEIDTNIKASTITRKVGLQIADLSTSIGSGSVIDAGLAIVAQPGAVGYKKGIDFNTYNGASGITPTGTLIHSDTLSAANGINFTSASFTGNAFASNNFSVTGLGAVGIGAATGTASGLHVSTPNGNVSVLFNGTTKGIRFGFNSSLSLIEGIDSSGVGSYQPVQINASSLQFAINNSEKMRIDSSGNVGIGTTTPTAQLSTTGTVRFSNFGAGTLTTDASGNLSVSSDERLKNIDGGFSRGLADIVKLSPIQYHWNALSGLDTSTQYAGFSAQNVQTAIPEAVGSSTSGYLTLKDRPLIAAAINAIKEIASITGTFKTNLIAWLGDAGNGISTLFAMRFVGTELCVRDGANDNAPLCLTKSQVAAVLAATGQTADSTSAAAPVSTIYMQAPVLELNGNASSTVEVGATYNDLGARIVAPESDLNLGIVILLDGATTSAVSIDSTQPGEHTILYTVTSPTSGLTGSIMRTVIIAPAEQSPEPPTNDNPFNAPPANDNASSTTAVDTAA